MKENKKKYVIFTIVLMLVCLCMGWLMGANYKKIIKEEDPVKEEVKPDESKNNKPFNNITEEEAKELVNPFIVLLSRGCSSPEYFYINETTTYKTISDNDKMEIAYQSIANKIDFEKFELKELQNAFKAVFGQNKKINFPRKLDIESAMANYVLVNNKYELLANGGGCIEFSDWVHTKVVSAKKDNNKITIRVNYGVLVRDNVEELEDAEEINEENITSKLYASHDKERIIAEDIKFNDEEEEVEKLLSGEDTDYIIFTFVKENNNYIFEKAELKKR